MRVATEIIAALLAPVELAALAVLPALPLTASLIADAERSRAHRLGAARPPMRTAVGSLSRWAVARSRTKAAWRHDLTIWSASLLVGLVGLLSLLTFGLGGVVLLCSPILAALGTAAVLGSWSGDHPSAIAGMMLLGAVALAVEAALLLTLSHVRDAALRLLDDRDEDRRAAVQLAAVRTNRAAVLDAFEDERRRIERDLHDGPQQDLVALSITLGMLEREIRRQPGSGHVLQDLAGRAHQLADQSLSGLRMTVRTVHPRELSDLGLFASIQELANRSPLTTEVECHGTDAHVSAAAASTAYYLTSEALTNVMKHAGPTTAHIHLDQQGNQLTLAVTDHGHGGAVRRDGHGLAGMHERVAALDGRLEVTSLPGHGTTITATIPTGAQQDTP